MKSKIIGLIIGVVVLSGLIFTSLSTKVSESPTIATSTPPAAPASTTLAASTTPTTTKPSTPVQTTPAKPQTTPTPTPAPTPAPITTPEPKPVVEGYTAAQVAAHADRTSCWSSVNGKVYDLTEWINKHPGGEREILSMCGKDGSRAFNNEHGGDNKPEKILASYYIGTLIN
jgi:predicted heme/steroid binding protein